MTRLQASDLRIYVAATGPLCRWRCKRGHFGRPPTVTPRLTKGRT